MRNKLIIVMALVVCGGKQVYGSTTGPRRVVLSELVPESKPSITLKDGAKDEVTSTRKEQHGKAKQRTINTQDQVSPKASDVLLAASASNNIYAKYSSNTLRNRDWLNKNDLTPNACLKRLAAITAAEYKRSITYNRYDQSLHNFLRSMYHYSERQISNFAQDALAAQNKR